MVAIHRSGHVPRITTPLLVRRGRLIETYSSRMQRLANHDIKRRSKKRASTRKERINRSNLASSQRMQRKRSEKKGTEKKQESRQQQQSQREELQPQLQKLEILPQKQQTESQSKTMKPRPQQQYSARKEAERYQPPKHTKNVPLQVDRALSDSVQVMEEEGQRTETIKTRASFVSYVSATKATAADRALSARRIRSRSEPVITWKPKPHPSVELRTTGRPNGLYNPRNFCYRRSFTQALLHSPEFLRWLNEEALTHDHPEMVYKCLICSLNKLAEAVWSRQNTAKALAEFDGTLRMIGNRHRDIQWLRSSAQHDSHEVYTWLVGALAAGCSEDARKSLESIFHLTTSGTWTCGTCHAIHTSSSVSESGLQLGIQIAPASALDLSDHLRAYFHQQVPDMTCEQPRCASKATRTRHIAISSFPRVLVIQLARFSQSYDPRRGTFTSRKCTRPVRYPRDLDMSEYAVEEMRADEFWEQDKLTAQYRLSSIVAHSGSLDFGHYIAYALGPAGVMRLDDERVTPSSMLEMLSPGGGFTPYLLFYRSVV